MTSRAQPYDATVVAREQLSPHLVRLRLACPGFVSTGVPDEWVGLVVPGQFQSRYYTVRAHGDGELVLDVVVHDEGLVTEWVGRDEDQVVGQTVVVHEPQGSFTLPDGATWLLLVGDLTALPAIARIVETSASSGLPVRVWAEAVEAVEDYLPDEREVTWTRPADDGTSRLAELVAGLDWPKGEGYFWMAGESAQMRAIRKHLMRERKLSTSAYDVMGYWRVSAGRQPRAVDPGPIWREGKAQGLTDEQIWQRYDEARS